MWKKHPNFTAIQISMHQNGNKVVESDQISSEIPRGWREHHADGRAQSQKDIYAQESLGFRIKLSVNVPARR